MKGGEGGAQVSREWGSPASTDAAQGGLGLPGVPSPAGGGSRGPGSTSHGHRHPGEAAWGVGPEGSVRDHGLVMLTTCTCCL